MGPEVWDRRYGERELVWSAEPNRFVAAEITGLAPGRALDLAAGEGRNAIWLAGRGWDVVAADFSAVGIEKGRRLADHAGVAVEWVVADVTAWDPPGSFDLVLVCYLQLEAGPLAAAFERVRPAVAAGATVLVVGHDRRNPAEGTGGPQDPAVLLDADEVVGLLDGFVIERAEVVERPVEGSARPALDTLVRARAG